MITRHLLLEMASFFPYKAKSSSEELNHHNDDGMNW